MNSNTLLACPILCFLWAEDAGLSIVFYFIFRTQKSDSQHRFLCANCPTTTIIYYNVHGRLRTFGAFRLTTLAGWHLRPTRTREQSGFYALICAFTSVSITIISSIVTSNTAANTTRLSIVGIAVPCCHL